MLIHFIFIIISIEIQLIRPRLCDLSPCKENDMSRKSIISDRNKRNDSSNTASGSSLATSALDRLRYNLSPVTSYYKPLIKSFSRRDDSPSKVSK